jgi:hypothetical protein
MRELRQLILLRMPYGGKAGIFPTKRPGRPAGSKRPTLFARPKSLKINEVDLTVGFPVGSRPNLEEQLP